MDLCLELFRETGRTKLLTKQHAVYHTCKYVLPKYAAALSEWDAVVRRLDNIVQDEYVTASLDEPMTLKKAERHVANWEAHPHTVDGVNDTGNTIDNNVVPRNTRSYIGSFRIQRPRIGLCSHCV